jgi:sugar phosphate isomerase/epimerase
VQWETQRDRLRRAVETAAAIRAPHVVLTTGPAGGLWWEDAQERFIEAIDPLLPLAASTGVQLLLEHTNSLRVDVGFVHRLRDAVDLARTLGIGVCMEINACWSERGLKETMRAAVDVVELVQVSDFAVGTKTTPDRLVPGDGDIPLERIIGRLLDAGYEGVFELELIGPRIEAEGYAPAIERGIRWLDDLLSR